MKPFAVYIKNQAEGIAKEIIFRRPLLFYPKKIPLCFQFKGSVSPAVSRDHDLVPGDIHRIFNQYFRFFRHKLYSLLFIDFQQEFFHIPFVAIHCGQPFIRAVILPVQATGKNIFKPGGIEDFYRFLPVFFCQIGKMEHILNGSHAGFDFIVFDLNAIREFVFPIVGNDKKRALHYISRLRSLRAETIGNRFLYSYKFFCQAFHPYLR